ncbi:ArnT family glycosyltransferase [Dictyobacter kobayashii]|uniref:Glycosyltransferase RgtA/B/C/D-like domain-containing protein n=1 Tax=Dictyobacter kobayashii TaxID=2014872 RepID=A0A402ATL3_9CHLR|nr:glycosyltransferase family 39 protein [Dictyobacter kobayashii]GCE22442.1 hypothetical protein KDK_62420 [Dictyobacter kobayashii]
MSINKFFRSYFAGIIVFFVALIVRVGYNLTVGRGYQPLFDAHFFRDTGLNIVNEHCFCLPAHVQSVGRAPAWPTIIALISIPFGPATIYPRLFLCCTGAATCFVVYLFARNLFGQRIAIITGLLAAIYPGLFIYDGWLYAEGFYTFTLTCFCFAQFKVLQTKKISWIIASGFFIALSALTRPNGLMLIGLIGIWAIILCVSRQLSWKVGIQAVVISAFVASLLIIPWTIRNYAVTGKIIPIEISEGATIAGSYNDTVLKANPYGYGMWMPNSHISPPLKDYSDAGETAAGLHWIRTHLSSMPYLLTLHFRNMWIPYTSDEGLPMIQFPTRLSSHIVSDMIWIMTPIIILLAFLGLLMTWRRWKDLLGVYLTILLTCAVCIVFYGSSRFRAPIEPLLVLLTGACIWWLSSDAPGTLRYYRHYKKWRV